MDFQIVKLQSYEVAGFWPVFVTVLKTEFPGYTSKVVDYFVQKIYTQASFVYWLSNNLKTVIVAKVNFQIVGFAVIDEPYGGVSFCRWLGIKQDFQKKGIGKKIVDEWLMLAKSQHCHKAEVASQPGAKAFYEKISLDYEGERKLSYFGITQYLYGKIIGQPDDEIMTK